MPSDPTPPAQGDRLIIRARDMVAIEAAFRRAGDHASALAIRERFPYLDYEQERPSLSFDPL
jgi:hypothetical protein